MSENSPVMSVISVTLLLAQQRLRNGQQGNDRRWCGHLKRETNEGKEGRRAHEPSNFLLCGCGVNEVIILVSSCLLPSKNGWLALLSEENIPVRMSQLIRVVAWQPAGWRGPPPRLQLQHYHAKLKTKTKTKKYNPFSHFAGQILTKHPSVKHFRNIRLVKLSAN